MIDKKSEFYEPIGGLVKNERAYKALIDYLLEYRQTQNAKFNDSARAAVLNPDESRVVALQYKGRVDQLDDVILLLKSHLIK